MRIDPRSVVRPLVVALVLLGVAASACASDRLPPQLGGSVPQSHGGPVRDHVSFVDALRAAGYGVAIVGPVQQPFLRAEPAGTVVAHVPFPAGLHVSDYEVEARRMYAQIAHGQPIVNGYSSNFPRTRTPLGVVVPIYSQFQLAMAQQFPSEPLLCVLQRSLDVTTLVVDRDWLAAHAAQMDAHRAYLEPAYADEAVQIYRLRTPAGGCASG